ncbi:uncharacterized protein PRCAT00001678001 [Priceomyces carsonii]|uniref:uncharacterized protein n=1 Tax=Priceomyces carsonii TaxID=28549 RepID=UPI002ED92683|nr:unnamed protein product [Priceomyces carsonii]
MIYKGARGFAYTARHYGKKPLYAKTLLLPQSTLGPKIPVGEQRLRLIQESSREIYDWQLERTEYSKEFVLHDGPPYANGDLHLGHAINKILKDIINRFELIHNNAKVKYRPGWDCHGLPIEMKAILGASDESNLLAIEIRSLCRELALSMIKKQRTQFLDFAIMTNFDDPYITMSRNYEIQQLRVFQKLIENGLLSRQLKPVWWGCETKTALAEAELEYNDKHNSIAIYVKFPVSSENLLDKIHLKYPFIKLNHGDLKLLIWTSTAWTIPANKAICINKNFKYTLLHDESSNEHLVVAELLADRVCELNNKFVRYDNPVLIDGSDILGSHYINPAIGPSITFPVLHGDHVLDNAGSGLVHTAPAHGMEDYLVGQKYGLNIESSVDEDGCYIEDVIPGIFKELANRKVTHKALLKDCINIMDLKDMIYSLDDKFKHSYPYDWRSKKPVIQRSTPQWFINIDKIKSFAINSLRDVDFYPQSAKNRFLLFLTNRSEWCISRQRVWGVPLPMIYHKCSGEPITEKHVVNYVIDKLEHLGTDEWFRSEANIERWLPGSLKGEASNYVKGKDTMDVWFDSGTSWTTLSEDWPELVRSERHLADVYLEGSDQHRGWFQSSLLNKIIASGKNGTDFNSVAPFKKVITHGFTLDKDNNKMSKSKGNVIAPLQVIEGGGKPSLPRLGTDGIRLWVASSNYNSDISVSNEVLSRIFENVKKFRITLKFLIGNLFDFKTPVEYQNLSPLDKYVLSRLLKLQKECVDHYQKHNFLKVVKAINTHVSSDLSASYFDISKDCLYTDAPNSHRRRGIQTVLQIILRTYIGLLAPVQPLLTQEAWNESSKIFSRLETSPFMVGRWEDFYELPEEYANATVEEEIHNIWQIREAVFKVLEYLKMEGKFKNKLETVVNLDVSANSTLHKILCGHKDFLCDYFLVSRVTLNKSLPDDSNFKQLTSLEVGECKLRIEIGLSDHAKCPRCWKFISETPDHLCSKCHSVVKQLEKL